jgi:RNA polymerase sigma-70 factor (ECF subfamily)
VDVFEDEDDGENVAIEATDFAERIDLESAIAKLPRNARVAFVLHEIEGFSHNEIAATMGIAAPTVRSHVFRARHLLMEILER